MGLEAWITILVVAGIFVLLVLDRAPTDVLFIGATSLLALFGIITPQEAFAGFSNSGVLTVAVLFVVAAGLRETGALDYLSRSILGRVRTARGALGALACSVVPLSAFLNNTPIVAMFMPIVLDWSRRHSISPSRLLIPLSYLTILGGTCTLIGTSTNLVVHGLMLEHQLPGIGMFELSWIGVPSALLGGAWLYFAGHKLLPDRKELLEQLGDERREYLTEMLVAPGCRLIGMSIEKAGLRHLPGLFLIEIDRAGKTIAPAGPEEIIETGDRLIFAGIVSGIIELERIPGLVPAADPAYEISPKQQAQRRLCEAVISPASRLIGKTIRDAEFRAAYGAAVVAVHRGGRRLEQKIGDVRLRPGDTLLLQAQAHFPRAFRNDPAFYLVSAVEDWRPLRHNRAWLAVLIFLALIVMMTTGLIPTLVAGMLAAALMIACGCIAPGDARRSIEWQTLITIAASFGVGQALENSGAAQFVAGRIVQTTSVFGPLAALAALYLLGSAVTEMITNNAAAVLLFPFCLETAQQLNVSPLPFLFALTMSASASFMTPIGYQTNMMVYGPGGYRFTDFMRAGAPLHLLLLIVSVTLIPLIWKF